MDIEMIIGWISNGIQIGAFLFSIGAWFYARRIQRELESERRVQAEKINVCLRVEGSQRHVALPITIRRGELSRAELLGRLGMVPMRERGKRFALSALSDPAFMDQVDAVRSNGRHVIIIPSSDEEIDQFAI